MSYEIQFTGSNVDRRNVSQLSVSGSLSGSSSNVTPLGEFEGQTPFPSLGETWSGSVPNGTDIALYHVSPVVSGDNSTGAGYGFTLGQGFHAARPLVGPGFNTGRIYYATRLGSTLSGKTVTVQIQWLSAGLGTVFDSYDFTQNRITLNLYAGVGTPSRLLSSTGPITGYGQTTTNYSGTLLPSEDTLILEIFMNAPAMPSGNGTIGIFDIFAYRVFVPNDVITSTQTITEGVAPIGGTPITTQVQTLQNGSNAITSPSKLFGLRVNNGGTKKLEASYNPSADNNQDSYIDATDAKIITADTTTLSVESFGSGSPEYIERGSSIEVKDVSNITEN